MRKDPDTGVSRTQVPDTQVPGTEVSYTEVPDTDSTSTDSFTCATDHLCPVVLPATWSLNRATHSYKMTSEN